MEIDSTGTTIQPPQRFSKMIGQGHVALTERNDALLVLEYIVVRQAVNHYANIRNLEIALNAIAVQVTKSLGKESQGRRNTRSCRNRAAAQGLLWAGHSRHGCGGA